MADYDPSTAAISGREERRKSACVIVNSGPKSSQYWLISSGMGKTTKHQQPLYLEPEKAELLNQLAAQTRIAKAVLLREAVDDLLVKYKLLKPPRKP